MLSLIRTTKAAVKGYMVDRLKTPHRGYFPTLAGNRVFKNRSGPLQQEELPAISIYLLEDNNEDVDNAQERRHLKVVVEILAMGADADVQVDVISDAVYDIIRNDEYLGGLVEWCRYVRGQLNYDEGKHPEAISWVMEYAVHYLEQNCPDAYVGDIQPFRGAMVTYSLAGYPSPPPVASEEAGSEIDIPLGYGCTRPAPAYEPYYEDLDSLMAAIDINGDAFEVDVTSEPTALLATEQIAISRDMLVVSNMTPHTVLLCDNQPNPVEGSAFVVRADGNPVPLPFAQGQVWAVAKALTTEAAASLDSVTASVRPVRVSSSLQRSLGAGCH